jgi:hypothetical protein
MKSSSAPLTASVSRLASVYTPAVRAAVDTFSFSALASVRPTTSSTRTPRCPRTFGRLLLLLRDSLCNIHRRMPSHLPGTPCRTEHRSEIWAIPSLCRATPSATSERLVELLGSSPIPRSFVASCVSFQLRPLPSTGVTRLHRYNEPLRHPIRPGLSLASCPLIHTAITAGTSRVAHGPHCLHAVATTPADPMETCSLVHSHRLRPSPNRRRVGPCIVLFEACSAFTHVTACMLTESPMRPSTPKASAASLPPLLLRLLPGGANQFPGGISLPLRTSTFSRRTPINH